MYLMYLPPGALIMMGAFSAAWGYCVQQYCNAVAPGEGKIVYAGLFAGVWLMYYFLLLPADSSLLTQISCAGLGTLGALALLFDLRFCAMPTVIALALFFAMYLRLPTFLDQLACSVIAICSGFAFVGIRWVRRRWGLVDKMLLAPYDLLLISILVLATAKEQRAFVIIMTGILPIVIAWLSGRVLKDEKIPFVPAILLYQLYSQSFFQG